MTTNTELIADLQSNIVGDPFPLMRKAADAIEALESEIQRQYACICSHAEITHKAEDERDALAAQLAAAQPERAPSSDYQATFNAIADAAKQGANGLEISVSAFWKSYNAAIKQGGQ